MNAPLIVSGTRFYIAASPVASNLLASYEASTFTQIRAVKVLGDFVKTWNTSQDELVDEPLVLTKRSDSYQYSPMSIEIFTLDDAGQAMLDAQHGNDAISFKLLRKDNTGIYFTGSAVNRSLPVGDSESIYIKRFNLELIYEPIEF